MSVLDQYKSALANIIASHDVSDAIILEQQTCARLANLADPRGNKVFSRALKVYAALTCLLLSQPLAELEPGPSRVVLRLCCPAAGVDR